METAIQSYTDSDVVVERVSVGSACAELAAAWLPRQPPAGLPSTVVDDVRIS
jgi:hypothetical protein